MMKLLRNLHSYFAVSSSFALIELDREDPFLSDQPVQRIIFFEAVQLSPDTTLPR